MDIGWYPGHMAKTRRILIENASLVDAVVVVLDARVPKSSENPDIDQIFGGKNKIIVLNKADLAEQETTMKWLGYFGSMDVPAVEADSRTKKGTKGLTDLLERFANDKRAKKRRRGINNAAFRILVAGIPNSGKSTLINRLSGRKAAEAEDRPGVTRAKKWIISSSGYEILDTPGILWPKFNDPTVGINLAATGAIIDRILDAVTLSENLIKILSDIKPAAVSTRYKLADTQHKNPREVLEMIGYARSFLLRGGSIDIERAASTLLDEFRGGGLGRISLESPS